MSAFLGLKMVVMGTGMVMVVVMGVRKMMVLRLMMMGRRTVLRLVITVVV